MNKGWMKNDEGWKMNVDGWWFQAVLTQTWVGVFFLNIAYSKIHRSS